MASTLYEDYLVINDGTYFGHEIELTGNIAPIIYLFNRKISMKWEIVGPDSDGSLSFTCIED